MLITLVVMLAYGAFHTALAGWAKPLFRARFGERSYHGLYRILFNAAVTITLVPIGLLILDESLNQPVVWRLPDSTAPFLLAIQLVGVVGVLLSLLQIDVSRFLGTAQLRAYFNGDPLPLPDEPLQTAGVYNLVRHPLYLFSLLVAWPVQTMGSAYFGFCLGVTIYFVVGSFYEERRLIAGYGERYRDYQQRVPRLIPFLRFSRGAAP